MFLIRPRNPAHYPHAAVDRAPHYLETWLRHFPDSTPDTIDFEDWVENACYFYHLQDQPHEILRNSKGIGFVSGAAFANCGALLQGDMNAPASIMLGTWLNSDGVTPIQHRSRLVGNSPAVVRSVVNWRCTATRSQTRLNLIFPEGTRVAPGEQPPLQPGFAGLYKALDLPVVPVALDSGRLWPRNSFLKRPGIITIRLGDPVPAGLPRAEIEARVHAAMNVLDR